MKIFNNNKEDIITAGEMLLKGKLVAFPTETVYGVGVVYDNLESYEKLNKFKKRNPNKPYTLMLDDVNKIKDYADVNPREFRFLQLILPGAVTVVLKAKDSLPKHCIGAKEGTIGIRVPAYKITSDLLKAVGKPLLVPSLNKSGEKPINDVNVIKKKFNKNLDGLLVGQVRDNVPSTVISLMDHKIKVIREGKMSSKVLIEEYNNL